MNGWSFKAVDVGDRGMKGFLVAEVARTKHHKPCCECLCAIVCIDYKIPLLVARAPVCRSQPVVKSNLFIDTILLSRFIYIFPN